MAVRRKAGEARMTFVLGMIIGLALSVALLFLAIALAAMLWTDDEEKK